jgi:hypothetical protein
VAPWWSWYHKLPIKNFFVKGRRTLGSKWAQGRPLVVAGRGALLKMLSRSTLSTASNSKYFSLIHQSVLELSEGNQIQDGCHSRHLGWAAPLVIEGNLCLVDANAHKKIRPCVPEIIDGNQIQDGCHSRHLGRVAPLIIVKNLPLLEANAHENIQVDPSNRSHVNWRKPNSRWLPYLLCCLLPLEGCKLSPVKG